MASPLLKLLVIILALSTASGVLVHDMRLDRAALASQSLPPPPATFDAPNKLGGLGLDQHTHVERQTFSQAVRDWQGKTPRLQPRVLEDKKHLLQKRVAKGQHAFDSYHVPRKS